ncbi:hypothetical protein NP493_148g04028 [Ridgeia piscesae]|uniref:Uncharacterized protein n=1 Tax=Ridgeia piscesae TaxID=27915 RepID=A0AAD9P4G9_RIDPI|nr:hypothetical protein NP493_148g04028 [Ridgeia piscesae]
MNFAIVIATLFLLQASLLTVAGDDVIDGSGSGLDDLTTTEDPQADIPECFVCGHYDDDMKTESECGVEKTTYLKEECPSGSNCWIFKSTVSGSASYARGCYNETDCSDNTQEQCATVGDTELCKKCCTTDLCNSGKLELSSGATSVGFYLSTLATAVATFLLL